MGKQQLYWYFSDDTRRLRYSDGREIKLGVTHTIERPDDIEMCEYGLHCSKSPLDALQYAPGCVVWRVRPGGNIIVGSDKIVASERTYVEGCVDVEDVLRDFARRCALDVNHLWAAPDVVVRYLKTGDESLRAAAWAAAWDAAWAAARAAARAAAWDAARAAAWAAAWAAARDAAWAAARDAARAAARDAAREKQTRRLTQMLCAAIRKSSSD